MIRDFVVGRSIEEDLLVKSAETRLTKTKKPYLMMELTDGTDTIQAVDWDFGDGIPPERNSVLLVSANVTEFAGKTQLKINTVRPSDKGVEQFAPKGDVDVNTYVDRAKELMGEIENEHIRNIVSAIYKDNNDAWKVIPAAKGLHHAFVAGLLKHTVDVTLKARAIGQLVPSCNLDLVIGGALIHDMGKLWTYQLNGALIDMTEVGMLLEHIALGIAGLEKYRTPDNSGIVDLLQHIVSSHHGKLEYGSPTTPMFIEAFVVSAADGIDAKTQTILELNAKARPDDKLTDKSWSLENRQMFTQNYIKTILE